MINRIPDAEINPADVFEGDCFHRSELAKGFVKLLKSMAGPMTIALTAPYGGGKTWFLDRCAHLLKESDVPVVKLNAWETDYAKEPLAPLISEIATAFESELSKSEQRLKQVKSAATKVAAAAIPLAVRFATLGLLNLSDGAEGVLADAAQKIAEKRFDEFRASRTEITHLKKNLGELAEEMRSKRTNAEGAQRPPVVILVDELDRCRPSYAIEMLEVIKHLFSIPGIVFVLGIDREQLSASARAVFGQGLNADGYIRRFIDLECAMPEPDIAEYCESEGFKLMEKVFGRQRPQFQHVAYATGKLCKAAGFSIRKTNQLITRVGVAVAQFPRDEAIAEAMAFMTFLQMWNPSLYRTFCNEPGSASAIQQAVSELSPSFLNFDERNSHSLPFLFVLSVRGSGDKPQPFLLEFRSKLTANDARGSACNLLERWVNKYSDRSIEDWMRKVDFGAAFIA